MSRAPEKAPASAIAVYSGGMDSTVMLSSMLEDGIDVKGALSIDYGQKHRKEIDAAVEICAELGIEHSIADLRGISALFGHSGLTDSETEVPEGHYEEDSMKQTVVPNRNMILLAIAAGHALSIGAEQIAYAAHSGDHAIYPDCRNEFADAMAEAIRLCDWNHVELTRPFVNWSKTDIVRRGAELGLPFEKTWSCYKGGALHCGRCGTCVERREAFDLADVADPTEYDNGAPSVAKLRASDWRLT